MIDRWARLAGSAIPGFPGARPSGRSPSDCSGTLAEDRDGILGEVIDQEGRIVSAPMEPAELARREIAVLQKRKAEVAGLDRGMAGADYLDQPTPEIRQIHRRIAELHR